LVIDAAALQRDNGGAPGHRVPVGKADMTNHTHYTKAELVVATLAEWTARDGSPRFTKAHPVVVAHVGALAGLLRSGGLVIPADEYPTGAKASNAIRRMIDDRYAVARFGDMAAATVTVPADAFHTFDVWQRGDAHKVTADAMRPKVTQTLRRIIGRLPERGTRPNVAVQAWGDRMTVTAYRLV